MKEGAVYNPSYKSLHRDMVRRRNECDRTVPMLKDQDGIYADEIRRCVRMYERVIEAIEQDCPTGRTAEAR